MGSCCSRSSSPTPQMSRRDRETHERMRREREEREHSDGGNSDRLDREREARDTEESELDREFRELERLNFERFGLLDSWENLDEGGALVQPSTSAAQPAQRTVLQNVISTMYLVRQNIRSDQVFAILHQLYQVAETNDEGWLRVLTVLISKIPLTSPIGSSAIALVLKDFPLPSTDIVMKLISNFGLCRERALRCYKPDSEDARQCDRNMLVVLGCLADRFAGVVSVAMMTNEIWDYLLVFLTRNEHEELLLFALIFLEKFSRTRQNRIVIMEKIAKLGIAHPLLALEKINSEDYIIRQVGFLSQWLLDNVFVIEGRTLSYQEVDMGSINVVLDTKNCTEYIKVSANGLQARSDSNSLESIRSSCSVGKCVAYYEVEIFTAGVMQIGWCTGQTVFGISERQGVGDDKTSVGFDGCRQCVWHRACPYAVRVRPWEPGDILGCLMEISRQRATFYLNGVKIKSCKKLFRFTDDVFFAAATFKTFQSARFNFGTQPFRYRPDIEDQKIVTLNEVGFLTAEEKQIVPRWVIRLQREKAEAAEAAEQTVPEGSRCVVCLVNAPNSLLAPCTHRDLCTVCAVRLRDCPLCREPVDIVYKVFSRTTIPESPSREIYLPEFSESSFSSSTTGDTHSTTSS